MYLYFNREGILTTSIPHGSPVRQGSSLEIVVCLDHCSDIISSHDNKKLYNCDIELVFPNGERGTAQAITAEPPQCKQFRKTKDSEITYDLVDGRYYWTYTFKFTPEQATAYPGILEANVSMHELVITESEEYEETGVNYYGTAKIFVERTLGDASITEDLSVDHYNNIIRQLNVLNAQTIEWTRLANYAVYIATADRENVKRVEVKQDDDTFNVVYNLVPFEEQKGKSVGKAIDKELQTSDLVVDPGIVNNIPYVWNTVNGKLVVTPINTLLVNQRVQRHIISILGEDLSEIGKTSPIYNVAMNIYLYNYISTSFTDFKPFIQKTICDEGELYNLGTFSNERVLSIRYVENTDEPNELRIITDIDEYVFKSEDFEMNDEVQQI